MIFRLAVGINPSTMINGMMEMFWGGSVFVDETGFFQMDGETRKDLEATSDLIEFIDVCKSIRSLYAKHFDEQGERIVWGVPTLEADPDSPLMAEHEAKAKANVTSVDFTKMHGGKKE